MEKQIIFTCSLTELKGIIAESVKESLHGNAATDNSNGLGDYISESEAKTLLGKKGTWFWNMRTTGRLPSTKVGGKVFYSRADLIKLLDENKK